MLLKTASAGILLFTFIAVVLIVVPARFGPASISNEPATSVVSPSTISGRAEAELLVLRSDGFKPNEITRAAENADAGLSGTRPLPAVD